MSVAANLAHAAPAARLQSGVYGELQLVVASDGTVAGTYADEIDGSATRSCEFTLTGRLDRGGASASITVHSSGDPDHHGRLVADPKGVGLNVAGLGELPGSCETVSPGAPGQAAVYGRTGAADGSWFATVAAARTRFHTASTGEAGRGYLVKDDAVAIGRRQGARWQASFTAPSGRKTRSWIDAADLQPFPHG